MLDAFFTSIDESVWAPHRDRKETVGGKLLVHGKSFPKLKKTKLALIGNGPEADAFRKSFYRLQWRFGDLVMADLGNLVETEDETQRQFALSEAMGELLGMGIHVVVVGGRAGLMYGHYKAYRQHDTPVEIVQVAPGIDMEEGTPLRSILVEKPSNLFNIDFLGTQAYFI